MYEGDFIIAIFYAEFRACNSRHADERADLNHIGQQFMLCAVQRLDSFYRQEVRPYSADLGTHVIEKPA